jgi:ribosomal protein S18 acetylase RimI-like enzyme
MPRSDSLTIRRARRTDLPTMGRLGASLAQAHHDWDPRRFFVVDAMAEGYAWWLGEELKNRDAVLLCAVRGRRVVGYAYGRLEERDWNLLRDTCGVAIDLIVEPAARGHGAGRRLGEALLEALRAKGAPFVVLQAAARNRVAQHFFRSFGFRPTLVEMALDLEPAVRSSPRAARRRG